MSSEHTGAGVGSRFRSQEDVEADMMLQHQQQVQQQQQEEQLQQARQQQLLEFVGV